MTNQRAVALLTERLPAGLVHPGDPDSNQPAKVIPLPGLSSLGMPSGMAAHFAKEAGLPTNDAPKVIAEAIVNVLETSGLAIVSQDELEQLRAEAETPDVNPSAPTVDVYCACNRSEAIFGVAVGRAMVVTSGNALRARLDEVCACQ